MPLDQCKVGDAGIIRMVDAISGDPLRDLGMVPGRHLSVVALFPLGGPIVVTMSSVKIAMSRCIARRVWLDRGVLRHENTV